ncbi:hypothetical protein ACT7UA_003202 [Vibrio cholerae]
MDGKRIAKGWQNCGNLVGKTKKDGKWIAKGWQTDGKRMAK